MRIAPMVAILWMMACWTSAAAPDGVCREKKPWSENRGERLYNGIVLPEVWPPNDIDPADTAPMAVPYLKSRPEVVPIDVGRQLFVDDFLIETTELKRVYHRPEKYAGNPILKPETELEQGRGKNAAAVAKGGLWWNPREQMFQMWYDAGWIRASAHPWVKWAGAVRGFVRESFV